MTMKNKLKPGRKGLAIGAVLGLVALLAVLGAVLANSMGSSTNSQTTTQQDKLYASSILMQAGNIKESMDLMVANTTNSDIDTLTLDSTATTGLFGADGTMEPVKVPVKAQSAAADWAFTDSGTSAINRAGSATTDGYISVANVTAGVCTEINTALGANADASAGETAFCSDGTVGTANSFYKFVNIK